LREKLTAIIPAFNEEANIGACLESVSWADEVVVVDSFSSDSTVDISKGHGVQVVQHEYENSAAQKNWILPRVSNRWVLIVDADERVTGPLRDEILKLLEGERLDGYWIRRRNRFLGREIRFCGWQRDKVLRFFDREKGRYQEKHVHAEVRIDGRTGYLREYLLHDSYKSFSSYLSKLDRYTEWGAKDAASSGRVRVIPRLLFRPVARFLRMYLFQLGFLDGLTGFVLCVLAATSVFIKYAKLWHALRSRAAEGQER
jgi:glycosyltransferase involved in cell wall biosynthesis